MEGKVKWYNSKKGYGFIEGADGEDYFAHFSAVPEGVFLRENDPVTFEAVETEKGKQAQNIALAKGGAEESAEEPAAEEEAPAEETEKEPAAEEEATEESAEEEAPAEEPAEEEEKKKKK